MKKLKDTRLNLETALYIIAVFFFALAVIMGVQIIFGDDTEDKGKDWIDVMLQRVEEWNIQKAINETMTTAERFEK